jgi:tRNA threonylcarbamoyladenosine biosynthesis protein TsaB
MKILALDSATQSCSVAVSDDRALLAEVTDVSRQTHSKHVMGLIQTAMAMARVDLKEIDGLAVTHGPGSFTGLRIGISTIKGLAEALGKPLVGVSCLKTLAFQAGAVSQLICPMIDARRGELYYAAYRHACGELVEVVSESMGSPTAALEKAVPPCLFIGNGAALYKPFFLERLGPTTGFVWASQNTIQASAVAQLGFMRFQKGEADDLEHFSPLYLRPSDAQIHLKSRPAMGDEAETRTDRQ